MKMFSIIDAQTGVVRMSSYDEFVLIPYTNPERILVTEDVTF